VARGWEGVCYILDEGIFCTHASNLSTYPSRFFYTGRLVLLVSSDNLRYREVPGAG
jgi:hypothetical protein